MQNCYCWDFSNYTSIIWLNTRCNSETLIVFFLSQTNSPDPLTDLCITKNQIKCPLVPWSLHCEGLRETKVQDTHTVREFQELKISELACSWRKPDWFSDVGSFGATPSVTGLCVLLVVSRLWGNCLKMWDQWYCMMDNNGKILESLKPLHSAFDKVKMAWHHKVYRSLFSLKAGAYDQMRGCKHQWHHPLLVWMYSSLDWQFPK